MIVFLRSSVYQLIVVTLSTHPIKAATLMILIESLYVIYYSYLALRLRYLKRWFISIQRITNGASFIIICLITIYCAIINWGNQSNDKSQPNIKI